MTPARTRTYGVMTPFTRQLLLEATLCLLAALVFHAASTCRMIFKRFSRDWHMTDAHEVLPSETSSIHAPAPILRDDQRAARIPQDEAGARISKGNYRHKRGPIETRILKDRAAIVSKGGAGSPSPQRAKRARNIAPWMPSPQPVLPEAAQRLFGTHRAIRVGR